MGWLLWWGWLEQEEMTWFQNIKGQKSVQMQEQTVSLGNGFKSSRSIVGCRECGPKAPGCRLNLVQNADHDQASTA